MPDASAVRQIGMSWVKWWLEVLTEACLRKRLLRGDYLPSAAWSLLVPLAKRCGRSGRLEGTEGPMELDEISDATAIRGKDLLCAIQLFESWGWMRKDGDCWVLPNFMARQETEKAAQMRERRAEQKSSSDKNSSGNSSGNSCRQEQNRTEQNRPRTEEAPSTPTESLARTPDEQGISGQKPCNAFPLQPVTKALPKLRLDMASWTWEGITDEDRAGWQEAYPGIDLDAELRKAREWVRADPAKRRKTAWRRFLVSWFGRAQDGASKGGNGGTSGSPATKAWYQLQRILSEFTGAPDDVPRMQASVDGQTVRVVDLLGGPWMIADALKDASKTTQVKRRFEEAWGECG